LWGATKVGWQPILRSSSPSIVMVKVPGYGYVTIIARVEETASSNGTWWDKRIQGELLKLVQSQGRYVDKWA
jgi:hypothetical protein